MSDQKLLHCRRKTVLILTLMVGISCLIIFRRYLFGGEPIVWTDIGSDTSQLYIPQYAGIIHQIRAGDFSFWNWRDGFGVNMNLFNLTNPVLILVYLYGLMRGVSHLAGFMVYVLCVEMYLSALFAYLYLSAFHFDERAKCLASYMYGFSGFILIWGQHFQFGAVYLLLPLMLLMTERMLRNQRAWKALTLMTALIVVNSMYTGYMTLLTCAGYVVVRLWMREKSGFLHWLKNTIRTGLAMLLGVGISGFALLPSALPIFTVTSRMKSDLSIWQRVFLTELPRSYYKALYYRLFSTTGMGISDYHGFTNYYEDPCLFFSTLFILLAIQYIFLIPGLQVSKRNKVLRYAAGAFTLLAAGTAAVGVVMNGFSGSFSRYMFLMMPYFALVSAETLNEILVRKRISLIGLVLGILLIGFSYWKIYRAGFYPEDNEHIKVLLATGICMGGVLFLLAKAGSRKTIRILETVLGILLMINVISDGKSNFRYRYSISQNKAHTEISEQDTARAVKQIRQEDPEFYRIEKNYHETDGMDGMLEDYDSVSGYNSTQNGNIQRYVQTYWPTLGYKDQNHYLFANGMENLPQSELTGVRYVLAEHKTDEIPGFAFDRMIGKTAVFKNQEVHNIATYYSEKNAEQRPVTGEENGSVSGKIAVNFADRDTKARISLPRTKNSGKLKGSVKAPENGYLFLAVPYENGWSVSLDGKSVTKLMADEGFTAVKVTKGTHTFSVTYHCPGVRSGLCMTAGSLVLLLILAFLEEAKARKKKAETQKASLV